MTSIFDLFKIGIGPSSSHTVGPMIAAKRFRDLLGEEAARIEVELFGSLAWTGKGHGSDKAVSLGLKGATPSTVDPDTVDQMVRDVETSRTIRLDSGQAVGFDPAADLKFNHDVLLPPYSNSMRYRAFSKGGALLTEKVYYSIGGGFIIDEQNLTASELPPPPMHYPFATSSELLDQCAKTGLSIAGIQLRNEKELWSQSEIEARLDEITNVMFASIDRGFRMEGLLPGKLRIKRRAKALKEKLEANRSSNRGHMHEVMDWISAFAVAVSEENAAGSRVVTAPTNGAAGIVPAVLRYFMEFCPDSSEEGARIFLLTAGAIGGLIKRNASISGAEVGCQGEIGSAAAMAAAGLAAALGASPSQIENAAEIAMEHHLGMTCDPIGGLVQIPCIERNAFGANKAVAAASLALKGDGVHYVSLDQVIETMRQTGADMQSKYKETSLGGLAVNVAEC